MSISNFQAIQEEQSNVIKTTFTIDLASNGVLIDDKLKFDIRALQSGVATFSQGLFPIKIDIIEIQSHQRNVDKIKIASQQRMPYYSVGEVVSFDVTNTGVDVEFKLIDLFGNETKNILPLLENDMIKVVPIIESGRLVRVGLALEMPKYFEL